METSRLLNLPGELRNGIFEMALKKNQDGRIMYIKDNTLVVHLPETMSPFHICRQLRRDNESYYSYKRILEKADSITHVDIYAASTWKATCEGLRFFLRSIKSRMYLLNVESVDLHLEQLVSTGNSQTQFQGSIELRALLCLYFYMDTQTSLIFEVPLKASCPSFKFRHVNQHGKEFASLMEEFSQFLESRRMEMEKPLSFFIRKRFYERVAALRVFACATRSIRLQFLREDPPEIQHLRLPAGYGNGLPC